MKKTQSQAGDNALYFVVRFCGENVFSPLYSGLSTFLPQCDHLHNSELLLTYVDEVFKVLACVRDVLESLRRW